MEGNPTNKDTNIEDHLNGGSISMGTTTIAQKAPQLVLTDLVHQLEPPIDGPEYPLPVPDNTLLTLTEWVYSLDLPLRVHSLALAIVRRVSWDTGKGCWASLGTLANDARLNKREASRGFRYLKEQRIIGRKRSLSGPSETWLIREHVPVQAALPTRAVFGASVPATIIASVQDTGGGENQLLLQPIPINQKVREALDPKVDDLLETEPVEVEPEEPEPVSQERAMVDEVNDEGTNKFSNLEEETGATTRAKRVERPKPELQPLDKVNHGERETMGFTVLEEEETRVTRGAKVGAQVAQEWVDLNLPESLMDSQCEWMLNHTWEVWKFHEVTQPYGWKFGKAAALKTVTKDMAARKKFRVDLVQHLMKAGLPSTATPSTWCLGCSKDTTTGHGNAFLEGGRRTVDTCEDCAQAPVPIVEIIRTGHRGLIRCEECGKKIKREPDKTHCYSCSKKLVDGPALARTL